MEYLFSYGTLQDESIQIEIFGRRIPFDNDELPGYIISSNKPMADIPYWKRGVIIAEVFQEYVCTLPKMTF